MTLGAALIETEMLDRYRKYLQKVSNEIGKKSLHCRKLKHFQKVHYAKRVAQTPVRCFGVISLKSTLGWYKEEIDQSSNSYYNKCAQYLLERVGEYMEHNDIHSHKLDVIFETGNFDYEKLQRLIRKCQDKPTGATSNQTQQIKLLRRIDADNIQNKPKEDEPLLQLADLVAHSLYKCVNKSKQHLNVLEPRYLIELRNRYHYDVTTKAIIGKGIKPVHRLSQLKLDTEIHGLLRNFKHVEG